MMALILAGLVEGASMTTLLPILSSAVEQGGTLSLEGNQGAYVYRALQWLGLTPTIGILIGVLVIGTVLRSGLVLFSNKYVGYTIARLATDLRLLLLKSLLAAQWSFYLRQPVGTLANAMSSEPDRASKAYFFGTSMLAAVIQMIAYISVSATISWRATVAYMVGALVILVSLQFLVRMAKKAGKRQTKVRKALLHQLTDCLQSVKPLKAMGREELADRVIAAETQRLNRALEREVLSKEALKAVQAPAFLILVAAGFYVGLVRWHMPAAQVMVLLMLLSRVMAGMGKVQRMYQNMAVCESAYWSLNNTIVKAQSQREAAGGGIEPSLETAIQLQEVRFAYNGRPILKGLSLEVPAASLTALIGHSGAGKTTVVDLIIGLMHPRQGSILVDGTAIENLNMRSWRQMIGYVPQENLLLHDTVFTNVTFGDPRLTEADAERALKAAGAWDFIAALPEGMMTVVGERGARLSGGQRQRIMIARALVHRPRLLILDEATSALDPESQRVIRDSLSELKRKITILAISHQPILVEIADRVYQLEEGKARRIELSQAAVAALN